jgi:hypothetical protein
MATSFGALCTDFYINQKIALKMDLPADRETILHLFDRIKRAVPGMDRFHRYEGELTLESSRRESEYRWIGLRRTSIRTAHVNPSSMEAAYKFHRLVLTEAPYHLTISPLDVDYLELLFGFDLECKSDHDEVIYEALIAGTPLANLLRPMGEAGASTEGTGAGKILDVQPMFGMALDAKGEMQAYFEVKTRTRGRRGQPSRYPDEPISLYVTVRRYGPVHKLEELEAAFVTLAEHAETLATERLVPDLLTPIARQIPSSP